MKEAELLLYSLCNVYQQELTKNEKENNKL